MLQLTQSCYEKTYTTAAGFSIIWLSLQKLVHSNVQVSTLLDRPGQLDVLSNSDDWSLT